MRVPIPLFSACSARRKRNRPAVGCPPYDHQRKKNLCGITRAGRSRSSPRRFAAYNKARHLRSSPRRFAVIVGVADVTIIGSLGAYLSCVCAAMGQVSLNDSIKSVQ
jgi:hypothetical protein